MHELWEIFSPDRYNEETTRSLPLFLSYISLSLYNLFAKPKNKDRVSSPSSFASMLLLGFFHKAVYDDLHLVSLGASFYYVPAPIHGVKLGIFPTLRAYMGEPDPIYRHISSYFPH